MELLTCPGCGEAFTTSHGLGVHRGWARRSNPRGPCAGTVYAGDEVELLRKHGGDVTKAADEAGISRQAFYRRLRQRQVVIERRVSPLDEARVEHASPLDEAMACLAELRAVFQMDEPVWVSSAIVFEDEERVSRANAAFQKAIALLEKGK